VSLIFVFRWGRPRAINLADSDVEELTEADFKPEEPGCLPSLEHTQFFLELCNLCFIIVDWLDLLRPGGIRQKRKSKIDRDGKALSLLGELQQWHVNLPPHLQLPRSYTGLSLWTATLHITYQAVLLRFSALLPGSANTVHDAVMQISRLCEELDQQDLLGSLWNFGIHDFDLAMTQHAREANDKDPRVSRTGLTNLRRGLPWLRRLCRRSSVASQGLMFYEELVMKMDDHVVDGENDAVSPDADETTNHTANVSGQLEWEFHVDYNEMSLQPMSSDPGAWAWESFHDQMQTQQY